MGIGAETGAARYKAFISYSHKDAAMGRWLHRRLEGYRLPRRLVGTEGERGEVPARLAPIFRDREELPAAGDLSEKVRAALAESESLIVVCSPDAAASPWVAKEIATFRALHPARPVLAAIVEGEPAECFSPALTGGGRVEPLAADLRPGRDGRRLGLLKLVAGLSGVGLDSLVQRDAQRRVRRVTYVTAAALAAVLAMAVLTVFAFRERREAERQRAQAEGMVEFMLTDLRERLKAVGRLDVLGAVNERALDYYQHQDLRRLSPDSLDRRARILQVMGDDDEKRGRLVRALELDREAARTTSALLLEYPDDPRRARADAQSRYRIGRIFELNRQWAAAQRHYAANAATADRLLARAPLDPDNLQLAASSAINLGNVQLNGNHDYAAAARYYQRGLQWYGRLVELKGSDVDVSRDRANAYGWLADSFFMQSKWTDSLAARSAQYRIAVQLHQTAPDNVEDAFRLALAERGLARSLKKVGALAAATPHQLAAFASARRLTRLDPANAEWLLFRGFVDCDLYYGKEALPAGGAGALRTDIRAIMTSLNKSRNPRASELTHCAAALE
jgi:hypothetical protein